MIEKLDLRFGAVPGEPPLDVPPVPVTVFVGPNNSGKSKVLLEIEQYLRRLQPSTSDVVLQTLKLKPFARDTLLRDLARIEQTPRVGESVTAGHVIIGKVNPQNNQEIRVQLEKERLLTEAQNPRGQTRFLGQFLGMYTLRLDGKNRLSLVGEQNAGDLQTGSANHLTNLFVNDDLRREVRRIVQDAFGQYLVIDPTNIGKLRVRLSERPPADDREEKGWDQRAIEFHGQAALLDSASDGVKAFVGIIMTLMAGDPKFILIDEPEAFLHPALAHKLGREIANSLVNSEKALFVSTHSAAFVMGCIQSGVPVNIVRLTYNYTPPTARLLAQNRILELMSNPLLRSTGVLNGLFFEAVIVTEADADRAFYQEINERLVAASDPRGIPNCLFLNAQNKQTVWDIVRPLRELGIPAAGIVDIDALADGGSEFTKVLAGGFIPEVSREGLHRQRQAVMAAFRGSTGDYKVTGIETLSGQEREGCENLIKQFAEYGVFLVPVGELERWLPSLGVAGAKGPNWLIRVFERIGSNPRDPTYLRPSPGDVWDFLGEVAAWTRDSRRRGIPA